ncbi:MAG: chemoreceptor glutamine deamidase CheD [Acidobacteriota bacterium]|nr:chemoreceptor glutamine deamidase CheD [Acidobacteriota bacterium]
MTARSPHSGSTASPWSPGLAQGKASKYFDRHFQRHAMKILPGEFYATAKDEVIVTVLGSCVSACLLDPVAMVGGMNHFMLPLSRTDQGQDVFYAARYGAAAMEYLINDLMHHGADRDRLVAKVFGGGKVMHGLSDVGGQNITFVRTFLQQESIPLWSEDLGGACARKVYLFPHTGQVLVKRLNQVHNHTLIERESAYLQEVAQVSQGGDVELFS